jgi:hypothetical protein
MVKTRQKFFLFDLNNQVKHQLINIDLTSTQGMYVILNKASMVQSKGLN